jgi:hypothetical protein
MTEVKVITNLRIINREESRVHYTTHSKEVSTIQYSGGGLFKK